MRRFDCMRKKRQIFAKTDSYRICPTSKVFTDLSFVEQDVVVFLPIFRLTVKEHIQVN